MLEEADDIMEVMPEVMVGKTGMISLRRGVTAGIGRLMNTLRRSRLLMIAGTGRGSWLALVSLVRGF